MKRTALIAMSGGVDSSAAALILQQQGWDCTGITMQLHRENALCGTSSDAEDAAAVAAKLGIPFLTLDATADFAHEVMDHFVAEYRAGRTPNPCIRCNRRMKFGRLMEERARLGCDILATGHYARVEKDEKGIAHQKLHLFQPGANGMEPLDLPRETALGALALYVAEGGCTAFQPMNINFGIMPPLGYRVKGKRNKNAVLSQRSLELLEQIREEILK